jgi:hypothetical protein
MMMMLTWVGRMTFRTTMMTMTTMVEMEQATQMRTKVVHHHILQSIVNVESGLKLCRLVVK